MVEDKPVGLTNYIGSITGVADTLADLGLDVAEILGAVGISARDLQSGENRFPYESLTAIMTHVAATSVGPLFGIRFADHVHATTYDSFGIMLISAKSLRVLCQQSERYCSYISTGKRIEFEQGEDGARLVYRYVSDEIPGDEVRFISASGWAATWMKLMRMVIGPGYRPLKVTFATPAPVNSEKEIASWFKCPVEYGADEDSILFSKEENFDQPLPGGNAELARRSEMLVFNQVRELGDLDMVNAVRIALFDLLPTGEFSPRRVAEYLRLDEKILKDGLRASGRNLQQIVSETRHELAEDYIMRIDLSVNEVAHMLGFSDCSNFARSFRRWTGESPTGYREKR